VLFKKKKKNDLMLEHFCQECYVAKAKQTEIKPHYQVHGMQSEQ